MRHSVSTSDHDILLHVGLPKTGTTSLQIHLRDNPESLARAGWRYAAAGRGESYQHLKLINALGFHRGDRGGNSSRQVCEELAQERATHGPLIVSHESFCKFPLLSHHQEQMVWEFLNGFRVKVVLYLRRPDHWMESFYAQVVKRGNEDRDVTSVAGMFGRGPYRGFETRFERIVTFFSEGIGDRGSLDVRIFDPDALVGGDVVTDFCNLIGADVEEVHGRGLPSRLNPSLAPETVHLMARLNRHGTFADLDRYGVEDFAREVDARMPRGQRPLLGDHARRKLWDRYRPDLEAVRPYLTDHARSVIAKWDALGNDE